MTIIYLIRHAEAEGNLYRRIHGWYDALVTENGLRQIQALEQRFQGEHFDAVWSSDLYRTCAIHIFKDFFQPQFHIRSILFCIIIRSFFCSSHRFRHLIIRFFAFTSHRPDNHKYENTK